MIYPLIKKPIQKSRPNLKMISRIGATSIGVWIIKHLVSPIQHWTYRVTGGSRLLMGGTQDKILLITTKGRRSGQDRTTPVFYLRDNDRLIICNVNPGFERTNPWVLNLRAHPLVRVQIGRDVREYHAREVTGAEMEQYWPQLLKLWPAYQSHFEKSGQRAVFVLESVKQPEHPGSIMNSRQG